IPVNSQIAVWYSKIACRTPWLISGWYGVYAVKNSPRASTASTTAGTSSTETTPIVASICSRSCSVSDRKLIGAARSLLLFEQLLVRGGVEQGVGLARIAEPDPNEPAFAVR